METAEVVTRQSANAASLSARTAELERSGMPLSTTTKSGGWRRTSPVVVEVQVHSALTPKSRPRGVTIIASVELPLGATVEVEVPRSPSSVSEVERP